MPADPGTAPTAKWSDLSTRITSAVVMILVGAGEILLGGIWFQMLVVFVVAVIVWEVARMIHPRSEVSSMLLAALAASVLSGVLGAENDWQMFLLLVVPLVGAASFPRSGWHFAAFALYVQIGGWALVQFRNDHGLVFVLWLLAVVIATDILGYFAGRIFGGPKFWPRVSPKKTWSGTGAGWIGAALVGWGFVAPLGLGWGLVPISIAVSLASQMGDIAESALKRRYGAKDSSSLIPGHGGVFDRFDALLGACVFVIALRLVGWPG